MQGFQTHPPQFKQCITPKNSPMPTHKGTGKRDGAVRRLSKPVCFEQNCEMKGVCTQLFDWVRLLVHDEGGS